MKLELSNVNYQRGKEVIELSDPQALLLVGDLILGALAQSSFSATIKVKENEEN